jgi:hypothetical protein
LFSLFFEIIEDVERRMIDEVSYKIKRVGSMVLKIGQQWVIELVVPEELDKPVDWSEIQDLFLGDRIGLTDSLLVFKGVDIIVKTICIVYETELGLTFEFTGITLFGKLRSFKDKTIITHDIGDPPVEQLSDSIKVT